MNEERIWLLLARQLAGEASSNDVEELRALLHGQPGWMFVREALHEWWSVPHIEKASEPEVIKLLNRIREN
jgi:hypothetical protein